MLAYLLVIMMHLAQGYNVTELDPDSDNLIDIDSLAFRKLVN